MFSIQTFYLFVIIISLVSCTNEKRIEKTTLSEINNVLTENIEIQRERFYKINRDIIDDINEPVKHKYRFLLLAAGNTISAYDDFLNSYEKREDSLKTVSSKPSEIDQRILFFKESIKALNEIDDISIATFDSLLRKDYKIIGLFHDEVIKRVNGIRKEYSILQNKLIPTISNDMKRNDMLNIKSKFLKYAAVHKAHFFIEKFRELAGGKVFCGPHHIFPYIQTKKNSVKKGETFEAKIFVGNSYNFHPLDNPKIIINEDTLDFDIEEEFVNYKFTTTKKGEKKLNLKFIMKNKLTGEVYTTSSEYVVQID